jgi:hypothetical protein
MLDEDILSPQYGVVGAWLNSIGLLTRGFFEDH